MSRKFDPFKWKPLDAKKTYTSERGVLRVLCSQISALVVEAVDSKTGESREILASVGTEHHIETTQTLDWRIVGPDDLIGSYYDPDANVYEGVSEVFTNIDRKPHESGSVLEVRKAMRQERLRIRGDLEAIREATRDLKRSQKAARLAKAQDDAEPLEVPTPPETPAPDGAAEE